MKTMATEVARVSVRVPPFWADSPEIWFAQIEAQFAASNITTDNSKFTTIIGNIESKVLTQVSEAVLNPPQTEKYENLKKQIISAFADSEQNKMKRLLSATEMGDRKPTQLRNEMIKLGGGKINDEFLKVIWLDKLPQQVRVILSTSDVELKSLAILADRIVDAADFSTISNVNQGASTSNTSSNDALMRQIAELTRKVE